MDTDSCESIPDEIDYEESDQTPLNMSRDSAMSVESLNTLLMRLPEISIPPPLYNPLPLQCLAASALPDAIKRDIEDVIAEVTTPSDSEDQGAPATSEVEDSEATDGKEGDVLEGGNEVKTVVVKRVECQDEQLDGLDWGLKITGGVKCDVCSSLHAVITKVSTQVQPLKDLKEGMCVIEWCGKTLDGCSFEEVRRMLDSTRESDVTEVEIIAKKCSNNLIGSRRIISFPKLFASVGLKLDEDEEVKVSNERPKRPTSLEVETITMSSSPYSSDPEKTQHNSRSNTQKTQHKSFDTRKSRQCHPLNPQRSQPNLFGPTHTKTQYKTQSSLPDTHTTEQTPSPTHSSSSHGSSRSTSPVSAVRPSRPANLTINVPNADSAAQLALTAAVKGGRPKSPVLQTNGFQDLIAAGLPNGMIQFLEKLATTNLILKQLVVKTSKDDKLQLCLKYDSDFEDLKISLNKVKGQSSHEISDTSDVFLNTYLIPDIRKQGTRSVKVKREDTTHRGTASYIIYEDELAQVALRVVLWDASRSKNIVFRGEVLLGLSNHDIVNLGGEPTWYTVCPADPNLPRLSKPVHYKQKGGATVEHLLQRFKHNLTTLKQHTFKPSSSIPNLSSSLTTGSLSGHIMRRNLSLSKKELRRTKKSLSGSYTSQTMYDMLESEIDNACGSSPSLEEIKQQLSSILKVLRETDDTEDCHSIGSEAVKKNKLSNILKVLQDTDDSEQLQSGLDSTDGDTLEYVYTGSPQRGGDDGSFSTLDYRVRKRNHLNSKQMPRPRSDSFKVIPDLRDSLGAGRRDKVTVYSFLEELESYVTGNSKRASKCSTTETTVGRVEPKNSTSPVSTPVEGQAHYKLVDGFQSENELDSPSKLGQSSHTMGGKSLDHSVYQAAVSLHRINIVDVDEKKELEQRAKRSQTLPNTRTSTPVELPLALNLNKHPKKPPRNKWRSKSVGDMEDLENEEELLLVRSPLTPYPAGHEGSTDYLNAVGPLPGAHTTVTDLENSVGAHAFSSLDFSKQPSTTSNRRSYIHVDEQHDGNISSLDFLERPRATTFTTTTTPSYCNHQESVESDDIDGASSLDIEERPRAQTSLACRADVLCPDGCGTLESRYLTVDRQGSLLQANREKQGLSKWRSLDNLLRKQPAKKTKTKKKLRKNSFMVPPPAHTGLTKTNSVTETGSRTAGRIKLELQFNTLNPLHPVLIVKMLDVVFLSPKLLSSDFSMKGYLYHSSTGVCVLKNKTIVNIKNPIPSAPMGILQFQTDITNLRLQVILCTNGKLFSKKMLGQVYLDLNPLNLDNDRPFNKWMELTKVQV